MGGTNLLVVYTVKKIYCWYSYRHLILVSETIDGDTNNLKE